MTKFILLLFFLLTPLSPPAQAAEPIVFSIAPERNVSELARLWVPFIKELERVSGLDIQFETAPNAKAFHQNLQALPTHAAFVDPYAYASFLKDHFQAVATPQSLDQENDPLGLIVVHKDAPAARIDDLAGQSFIFADSSSFSASILPRFHMQATGIPYQATFTRSAVSTALAVSRQVHDAAGIEVRVYKSLPDHVKQNLRIVWTSTPSDLCEGMKNHPFIFALNRTLPEATALKLRDSLIALNKSPKGQEIMQALGFTHIQLTNNQSWEGLKPLADRILQEG